jgi:hypothetical protein
MMQVEIQRQSQVNPMSLRRQNKLPLDAIATAIARKAYSPQQLATIQPPDGILKPCLPVARAATWEGVINERWPPLLLERLKNQLLIVGRDTESLDLQGVQPQCSQLRVPSRMRASKG